MTRVLLWPKRSHPHLLAAAREVRLAELADACDSGVGAINGRLIDAALAAWESS